MQGGRRPHGLRHARGKRGHGAGKQFPLSAPPRRSAIGHSRVAGAVGEARDGLVAAVGEIRLARIADRPATFARREIEQRAALHALDRRRLDFRAGHARGLRKHQAQELALRRRPRRPDAWRAGTRRRRGPPRRQAEAMDLADDGVTGDADLGGDLAAGQTGGDAVAQLFDPLRGPRGVSLAKERAIALGQASSRVVGWSSYRAWNGLMKCSGRFWAATGQRPRATGAAGAAGRSNAHSVREREILRVEVPAPRSPSRIRAEAIATRRFEWDPYAGLTGAALVLLCEKPSPVPTVSRFELPAKSFNDIITMF